MKLAILTLALVAAGARPASAQESSIRLNPYAGWYHFDESSFEKGFETSEIESDPVYGVRLAVGGLGSWSLDLSYGRTKIEAQGTALDGGAQLASDATIQLLYAALNWHLPLTGPLDLFLSGGVGGIEPTSRTVAGARTCSSTTVPGSQSRSEPGACGPTSRTRSISAKHPRMSTAKPSRLASRTRRSTTSS